MINKTTILKIDNNINQLLKNLDYKDYILYSDEGGIFGNPKFLISSKTINKKHFQKQLIANKNVIKYFILGRLSTWQIANKRDYSKNLQITIII